MEKNTGNNDFSKQLSRNETHIKWANIYEKKHKRDFSDRNYKNDNENELHHLMNNKIFNNIIKMSKYIIIYFFFYKIILIFNLQINIYLKFFIIYFNLINKN